MFRLKRHLADKINILLEMFPVVMIIGARQVGKTTLLKMARPDWHYFDLENFEHEELITRDPLLFFKQFPKQVIIDEAQRCPHLFAILRGIIDEDREQKGRFLLTGSANPTLLAAGSESLAGRIAIVELSTLKSTEYQQVSLSDFYKIFTDNLSSAASYTLLQQVKPKVTINEFQKAWLYGGYPEPLLADNDDFFLQWMDAYRTTYINRDIAKLFPKINNQIYQRFMKMIGRLSGTIVNKKELARSLEINEKTVSQYISIAEGTCLWRSLPSFAGNYNKSILKMPKGYIRDSGLLHYLLRIKSFDELFHSPIVGQSFEGLVIEEILKGLQASMAVNWQPYYFRTKHGAEIDLILEGNFGLIPIEIKQGSAIKLKQLTAISNFLQTTNAKLGLVINQADSILWLKENILQVPVNYI